MNQTERRRHAVVRLCCVLAWALLALCPRALALDPSLDISQYAHTSWKVRDGFPKGPVTDVAQTPDGYLWFGTESGLVRFDGVRAVEWRPGTGQNLPSDWIRSLLASRDGTLWIGTRYGLAIWKNGNLSIQAELSGQDIVGLLQDREGTVWVGTIDVISGGKLCAIRDGTSHCSGGDGILGAGVMRMFEDRKGNLWVGAQNGVWRWKPGRSELIPVADPSRVGVVVGCEDDRGLLIGTQTEIQRVIDHRVEPYPLGRPGQPIRLTRMLRDHDGGLWIGTLFGGLVHVHHGRTDTLSQKDGLSGDGIGSVFEDREGSIWVGTTGGVDRFREYAVPNISVGQGLSGAGTLSVLADNDGSVWVGTGNGLNRWRDGRITVVLGQASVTGSAGRPSGSFGSMFKDSTGRTWVAGSHGLGYIEKDRLFAIPDFPKGNVHGIAEVGPGQLWLAHQFAGLVHLVGGKVVQNIPWAGLGHRDSGFALAADPSQNGLWLGFAQGGVAYFTNGGIQKAHSAEDGLGGGSVTNLRFGPRGALWASTRGGLSLIKDGKIATLTSKNGLPCDAVHWSIEDDDHSVWLYLTCGLVRIERSEMDRWVTDTAQQVKVTLFGLGEGVPSRPSSGIYQGAVAKSQDGRLWFTTKDGVGVVDPRHLAFNKLPPPVHIEQITADRKTYDTAQGLRLPPSVRDLEIDFTALSFVAPEKVRFRYKLEGYDKDWQDAGNRRQAFYTNLSPRNYRFRVIAANNSGVWNEEGALLDFSIAPAFYQRTSFRVLCVVAFLALLFAAYELRVRQLARQFNRTLEARVSERTRIARELHDTLLQSFQGLLLRFQSVSNVLPPNAQEARQRLDKALDQAAAAITEGRDAVQGLRSSAFETNDLANGIIAIGQELTNTASTVETPTIDVEVEGGPRQLNPIVRDEACRVAGEALRNAFRHAQARRITVEIHYEKRRLRVRVSDDGKGIDEETIRCQPVGHFGLPGMRERAESVGGRLEVSSRLASGTEIELSIPGDIAYGGSPRWSWLSKVLSANSRHNGAKSHE
jgi:signal transduction histidine kinase/ligand-binding sensor domain-containing protein